MPLQIKRVYELATKSDGKRILVDRLWPRGLTKQKARVDLWLKDIGPSNELRKWFGHDPARWAEFRRRYRAELRRIPEQMAQLKKAAGGNATLVYGAKDEQHNQAVVLRQLLTRSSPPAANHAARHRAKTKS